MRLGNLANERQANAVGLTAAGADVRIAVREPGEQGGLRPGVDTDPSSVTATLTCRGSRRTRSSIVLPLARSMTRARKRSSSAPISVKPVGPESSLMPGRPPSLVDT